MAVLFSTDFDILGLTKCGEGGNASTTVMIGSGALTGCLGIGDTDKAGITWCTALDGVLTCSSTKPQQCK